MMKFTVVLLCMLSCYGCSTAELNTFLYGKPNGRPGWVPPQATGWGVAHIISDPPGAKIEINDNYIGVTPIDANLWYQNWAMIRIVANPVLPGQYLQNKLLMVPPIPQTIYFNMNLVPTGNDINVNINK